MKKILFVCTGNTCRSPMAQSLMNMLIEKSPVLNGKYEAFSAGLAALEGAPVSEHAKAAAMKLGVKDLDHSAVKLNESMCDEASLILTMEGHHLHHVLSKSKNAQSKAHTLKGYVNDKLTTDGAAMGIADPFGGSANEYMLTAQEVLSALFVLARKIEEMESEQDTQ